MATILERLHNYGMKGKANTSNEFVGRCPFHKGGHDTFAVNLKTGKYICFAAKCGARGHISKLIGDIIQEQDFSAFDSGNLFEKKKADEHAYILPDPSELENWRYLHPYILHRGFEKSFLIKNLIGYSRNDFSITIPIFMEGVYYGCIRRTVLEGVQPKYNYPKGLPKKNLVYRPLHVANDGSNDLGRILVVEGSLNALKAAQFGYEAAATLGCDPNEAQILALVKIARESRKKLCFLYDNDESGIKGIDKVLARYFWLECDVAEIKSLKYVDNGRDLCYNMVDGDGNVVPKNDVDNLSRRELDYVVSNAKDRFFYELEKL